MWPLPISAASTAHFDKKKPEHSPPNVCVWIFSINNTKLSLGVYFLIRHVIHVWVTHITHTAQWIILKLVLIEFKPKK